jgi:hypothetical protein
MSLEYANKFRLVTDNEAGNIYFLRKSCGYLHCDHITPRWRVARKDAWRGRQFAVTGSDVTSCTECLHTEQKFCTVKTAKRQQFKK